MDLLSVTPTSKSKFLFLSPVDGKPVKTKKGAEMYVNVFGAHTKEYQAATIEMHRRTIAIYKEHKLEDGDKITEAAANELRESGIKLQCDITSSILIEDEGKEIKSKKAFYENPDFEYWVVEVAKFANNTVNFIKA
jgi:hypothetical protein